MVSSLLACLQLHSSNAQKCHVSSIYDSSGTEVSSQKEIEQAQVNFYFSLFSEEAIDLDFQDDLFVFSFSLAFVSSVVSVRRCNDN